MKIDRETCPPGTRLLVWVESLVIGKLLCEWKILEWATTIEAVKVSKDVEHRGEWEPLTDGRAEDAEVVEILPASPAVPTLPGPWLEAWPSEIPDGSVWLYSSPAFEQAYGIREQAMIGKDGDLWSRGQFYTAAEFKSNNGDRIRRVG